jgi:membrane protein YqaA with SNARE-associated domain
MGRYEALKAGFAHWGVWIIIIKGLTPIPYKLVTIASGVVRFPIVPFAFASLVSRSLRFFLLGALLWRFGEPVREFIERRLMLVTSLFALALVGGFVVLRYL